MRSLSIMDTQRQVGFKLPGESSVQFAVRRTLQNAEEVATAVAEAQRRAKEAEDHAKYIFDFIFEIFV